MLMQNEPSPLAFPTAALFLWVAQHFRAQRTAVQNRTFQVEDACALPNSRAHSS